MTMRKLLAGLVMALLGAAAGAADWGVGGCVQGQGASFKLMCYYNHTSVAYQTIDSIGYRCMLWPDEPAYYVLHEVYFETHNAHNWSSNIQVGCAYNFWKWRPHYQINWGMGAPLEGVGQIYEWNGAGPGCGPPP